MFNHNTTLKFLSSDLPGGRVRGRQMKSICTEGMERDKEVREGIKIESAWNWGK